MTIDQRAAGLWRSGTEQEAMRVYLEEVRRHGDETVALAKIGRRPKTLRGYRRRFPEFAAEVGKALEHHRGIARGDRAANIDYAGTKYEGQTRIESAL